MTAGCSRFLSVGEYVYREPSVSAHFWQTAFIVPLKGKTMSLNYEQNENDILNKLLPEYRQHSVQRKSNPEAVTGHIGESEAE